MSELFETLTNDQRERLAAYAHEAWSGWMKWMFEHGGVVTSHISGKSYWVMLPEKYDRWQRQMNTPYADLPESEKESDRAEADKMLAIIHADAEQIANANGHPLGGEEIEELG